MKRILVPAFGVLAFGLVPTAVRAEWGDLPPGGQPCCWPAATVVASPCEAPCRPGLLARLKERIRCRRCGASPCACSAPCECQPRCHLFGFLHRDRKCCPPPCPPCENFLPAVPAAPPPGAAPAFPVPPAPGPAPGSLPGGPF